MLDLPEATDDGKLTAGGRVHDPGTSGLSEDGVRVVEDVAAAEVVCRLCQN